MPSLALILLAAASINAGPAPSPTLRFTANHGQWESPARFLARAEGVDLWVTDRGVTYDFHVSDQKVRGANRFRAESSNRRGHVVQCEFEGVGSGSRATGSGKVPGLSHYLTGARSASNVPSYGSVRIDELYESVDLVLYEDAETGGPRYDLVLEPGADLAQIKVRYRGASGLRVTNAGELAYDTSLGTVVERGLYAYQKGADGKPIRVDVRQSVSGGTVGFSAKGWDRTKTLVIDPLVTSTFVGGGGDDTLHAVKVGAAGSLLVAGYSDGAGYPLTAGAYDDWEQNIDAVVTKFAADGRTLQWSTFLGGARADAAIDLAVDGSGQPVVSGFTTSADFPTFKAYDSIGKGGQDVFVTKLAADGSSALFSTYFASSGDEEVHGIDVSASGVVYVVGTTNGSDLPIRTPYQGRSIGGLEGFVATFTSSGGLRSSTYLGGSGSDVLHDVLVDASGKICVVGTSDSEEFPTRYSLQEAHAGDGDGVFAVLSASGSILRYSTYVGGSGNDGLFAITQDDAGTLILAGNTQSPDVPVTKTIGAFGVTDALIIGADTAGVRKFATRVGGMAPYFNSVAADTRIYFAAADENVIPSTPGAVQVPQAGGQDFAIVRMSGNGSSISYLSRLGGGGHDHPLGIALLGPDRLAVVGDTTSPDFPTTSNGFDRTRGSLQDGFLTILTLAKSTVSIDPVFIPGQAATLVEVTIRIHSVLAQDLAVPMSGGSGIVNPPSQVTIPAGSTSVTFYADVAIGQDDHGKVVRINAKRGSVTATRTVYVP